MKFTFTSILLAASMLAIPVSAVTAQQVSYNNPGNSGGLPGSRIANPEYPAAATADPALSPGRLDRGTTGVADADNPNVAGATGNTVVVGDLSTIGGDRRGTIEQKTGGGESEGGNN